LELACRAEMYLSLHYVTSTKLIAEVNLIITYIYIYIFSIFRAVINIKPTEYSEYLVPFISKHCIRLRRK